MSDETRGVSVCKRPRCGVEFVPKDDHHVYCSHACRDIDRKDEQNARRRANHGGVQGAQANDQASRVGLSDETRGVPVKQIEGWTDGHSSFVSFHEKYATHTAYPVAEARLLEAVAAAARLRITCRQAVPPEVMAADRKMYAALNALASHRSAS